MKAGRVFFAVLNMGLGHATRSLPLMQGFRERDWQLTVGSSGRALALLRDELPGVPALTCPDYRLRYADHRFLVPTLLAQIPRVLAGIAAERRVCRQVVAEHGIDLVVSDQCFGMAHPDRPSLFISHQLTYAMPGLLAPLRPLGGYLNGLIHHWFDAVVVPDLPADGGGQLSGTLSEARTSVPVHFIGPTASLPAVGNAVPPLDLFVSISGPEPQRTRFEDIVLGQAAALPPRTEIVLGRSETRESHTIRPGLIVHSHLSRREMALRMAGAALVLTRPGYSTVMELAERNRKALFVPTPGQTEQEYLARHLAARGACHWVDQDHLDLARDLSAAAACAGLAPVQGGTTASVQRFFAAVVDPLRESRP